MGYNSGKDKRELLELDRTIKAFYTGEISTEDFVKRYWHDSWDSLLTYVQQSGFNMRNGKIPQVLIDKKEEFEAEVIKYFGNEYCEMTQISVNGRHIHPTIEDINEAIKFMRQNGIAMGKSTMTQTLTKYLRSEIEVQQEPEELDDLTGEDYRQAVEDSSNILTSVTQIKQDIPQIENADLDSLPSEELQRVLEDTIANNKAKESELEAVKRVQLLRRIKAEQQRGKMLDQQIREIKSNMNRGV